MQTARSLDEGLALVVAVDADHVDRANQGRLVHVSGQLSRVPLLVDEDLGVAEPGLRLERVVEMYQWHEKERTERHKDAYGNEHSRTTYTYTEQWSSTPIDSSRFAHGGYNNPANWPYISKLVGARSAALGAFQLREQELGQLPADQRVDLSPSSLEHMAGLIEDSEGEGPVRVLRLEAGQGHKHHRQHKLLDGPSGDGKDAKIQRHKKHSNALSRAAEEEGESNGPSTALVAVNAGFEVSGGRLYSTGALRRPRVGDLRIAYKVRVGQDPRQAIRACPHPSRPPQVSNPATVSVVAQQRGNRFAPFQTRSGDALLMVEEGELDEHTMFAKAQAANAVREVSHPTPPLPSPPPTRLARCAPGPSVAWACCSCSWASCCCCRRCRKPSRSSLASARCWPASWTSASALRQRWWPFPAPSSPSPRPGCGTAPWRQP